MNALDIALLVAVALFIVYGAVKGLVRLVLGSVSIGMGVLLACWYHAPVERLLAGSIQSERFRFFLAFGLVFLATLAGFAILVWLVTRTLEAANLRWIDRVAGALLGLGLATVLLAALLVPLTAYLPADSNLVGGSRISPYVLKISSLVKSIVPESLRKRYEEARTRMTAAGKHALPGGGDMPIPPGVPEVVQGVENLKAPAKAPARPKDPNG